MGDDERGYEEPRGNGGKRPAIWAPAWFIGAVLAAAALIRVGWWISELRHADIDALRLAHDTEMRALRTDVEEIRARQQANNLRICALEERAKQPRDRFCYNVNTGPVR